MYPDAFEIAVMAKAPQAGYAKTRLIPELGAGGAARLHRQLTSRTLATAVAAGLGPVTLWCAPDAGHGFFRALQRRYRIDLRPQPEVDLGQRMAHIFDWAGKRPLLLIGTDCPALTTAHLQQAAHALRSGHDAVFITTEDGGYFLVGLTQPCLGIFQDIDWSTPRVMAQTRDRMSALRLSWHEVAMLWDVDHPQDLARWQALKLAEAVE